MSSFDDETVPDAVVLPPSEHNSLPNESNLSDKVDSIDQIETTLQWYEHIAAAFLLYEDAETAWQKIKFVNDHHNEKDSDWQRRTLSPLFQSEDNSQDVISDRWKKLIQVLSVLKQKKLLICLDKEEISITSSIDSFRLDLFRIIDGLKPEEARDLITRTNAKLTVNNSDSTWCTEMHFLKWIIDGEMTENNYLKFLGLEGKYEPVKKEITKKYQRECKGEEVLVKPFKIRVSRGLCVIINQMKFYNDPANRALPMIIKENLDFRFGSEVDRDQLSETFRMLGHDVKVYENLNFRNLKSILHEISQYDFTCYDALIMCFLSHGERECVFTSDSIAVQLEFIKSHFDGIQCPPLINKPKLFFIQACQGNKDQQPVSPSDDYASDGIWRGQSGKPALSDFFEAWATIPGFHSYRSTSKGSVFITNLCSALQDSGHKMSLFELMTVVNQRISDWQSHDSKKQMSIISSSLTKSVEFKRPEKENQDKFVAAIADKLERELFDIIIHSAVEKLLQTDPLKAQKLIISEHKRHLI